MTEITDEMRAKVRSIRDQAQADPSFMERVKTDPAGVLRAEGIPDDAASQIVSRMAERPGEVAGYIPPPVEGTGYWCEPDPLPI